MANLLTDWLGPEIDKSLIEGIEWLRICKEEAENEVLIKQENGGDGPEYQRLYENDGSNLRVNVDRGIGERSCVQLVEFEETEPTIRVLLSDGSTSVRAKFSSTSIKAFQEQHRRRITERTRGGIITITKFQIVATPYGQSRWQVSLFIKKLDWQGSDGSPLFGRPKPVQDRKRVKAVLHKLYALKHGRSQTPSHSQQDPEPLEDIAVELSSEAAEDEEFNNGSESMLNTQAPLATQVPHPARRARLNSVELIGGANLSRPTQPGHSSPVAQQNISRPSSIANTKAAQVLRLLGKKPVEKEILGIGRHIDLQQALRAGLTVNEIANQPASPKSAPVLLHINEQQSEDKNLKLSVDTDNRDGNKHDQPKHKLAEHPETQRNCHVLDATADITNSIPQQTRSKDPMRAGRHAESKTPECSWMDNPITRHMCSIPSEQQALLSRPEAWLPSQPGMNFPGANIPIKVLECLNNLAERRASHEHLGATNDSEDNRETREAEKSSSQSIHHDNNQYSNSDSDVPTRCTPIPGVDINIHTQNLSELEPSPSPILSWSQSPSPEPQRDNEIALPPDSSFNREGDVAVTTSNGCETRASISSSLGSQVKSVSRTVSTTPRGNTSGRMKLRPHGNGLSPGDPINLDYLDQEDTRNWKDSGMPHPSANGATPPNPLVLHSSPPMASKDVITVDSSSSDEDDYLEVSIPRALEQDQIAGSASVSPPPSSNKTYPPRSGITQRISKLLVEETPYSLGRVQNLGDEGKISSSWSLGQQNSSGRSKDMTSSTPIIPSTYKDMQKPPSPRERKISAVDGCEETNPSSDVNEVMVDQQIQEEIKAASQCQHSSPPETLLHYSTAHQEAADVHPESSRTNYFERSPSPKLIPHIMNESPVHLSKRKAGHSSAGKPPKQTKIFEADFGFSQEDHPSEDAASRARKSRREFLMNLGRSEGRSGILTPAKAREVIHANDRAKLHHMNDAAPELQQDRFVRKKEAVSQLPPSNRWGPSDQKKRVQRVSSPHSSPNEHEVVEKGRKTTSAKAHSKISYAGRDHWSPSQEQISREDRIAKLNNMQPSSRSTFLLPQPNAQVSAARRQAAKSSGITALYSKFTEAYPDYTGDEKHFIGLCRMIDNLQKAEKMEHKSLWDDFIIRHKTNYGKYIVRCSEEGHDPVPYIKFYHDHIDEPAYTKRVMEPGILKSALDQFSVSPAVSHLVPSSSIPTRRPSNSPVTARSPKRSRRSLPWAQPPPSSAVPSSNRTRRSLPPEDHLRSKPPSQPLNSAYVVQDSPPGANAMEEKNEIKWHEQDNTPFKEFVSGYVRLKSVEGRLGTVGTNGNLSHPADAIDVLSWPFNHGRGAS